MKLKSFLCIITNVFVCIYSLSNERTTKLIIDNDGGADDAMAVFLALLYENHFDGPQILGLTTTHGNVIEEQCTENNQKFLKLAQRQEVPIYRGANESLVHPVTPLGDYFGSDGLGDSNITFTDLVDPRTEIAANALIEYSKTYEGQVVVITIGPLSNIALAIKLDPGFLKRLKQLYVAGGHIQSERHSTPEYNAKMDVEAFKVVMDHATADLVTVLPYSQTEIYLDITKDWRENVYGVIKTDIVKHMNIFERISLEHSDIWYALDPAMVACVLKSELITEIKFSKQNIITCHKGRGLTTNEFVDAADANVRIIYSINKELYKEFLIEVFSKDGGGNGAA